MPTSRAYEYDSSIDETPWRSQFARNLHCRIIDSEFPSLRGAYQEWLTPENFDSLGKQKSKLSECLQRHRERSGVLPNY